MLRLQRKLLLYLASIEHFPYLKLGGHLEILTPLTNIFIIAAHYAIYGAVTLDSLLSAHILVRNERVELPASSV